MWGIFAVFRIFEGLLCSFESVCTWNICIDRASKMCLMINSIIFLFSVGVVVFQPDFGNDVWIILVCLFYLFLFGWVAYNNGHIVFCIISWFYCVCLLCFWLCSSVYEYVFHNSTLTIKVSTTLADVSQTRYIWYWSPGMGVQKNPNCRMFMEIVFSLLQVRNWVLFFLCHGCYVWFYRFKNIFSCFSEAWCVW